MGDNIQQMQCLLISPSLQLSVSNHVAIQAEYSNARRLSYSDSVIAHCFYQSVFANHRLKAPFLKKRPVYVSHALTIEKEILPERVGTILRRAYRLQFGKQIFSTPYRLLASSEMVFNLNAVHNESKTGIDQNRTFIGAGQFFTLRFCT